MSYLTATVLSGLVIYLMALLFADSPSPTERHMDTLSALHIRNARDFVRKGREASAEEIREHYRTLHLPLHPSKEQLTRN